MMIPNWMEKNIWKNHQPVYRWIHQLRSQELWPLGAKNHNNVAIKWAMSKQQMNIWWLVHKSTISDSLYRESANKYEIFKLQDGALPSSNLVYNPQGSVLNPPKSQWFNARVCKSGFGGLIVSSIGAKAPQLTSTLNFGGEGVGLDGKGLHISSIYGFDVSTINIQKP